ncbi:ribosomal maturation YjgA family protein [Pseudotamlana agarivorans]|uniref:ribosomal maturation YjgA family protein n=1 Tax=Pseudotamlana agarivorans TaxID=481183 RepID=UPI0008378A46|nr:DUF2809 domain-containing protein [Tamlana agarivorans]
MAFSLNKTYIIITILLFLIEVGIATFIKTGFIRYTFGDYLVVILLYYFFKSFIKGYEFKIAFSVLVFAFFIEFLQLINILQVFNLQDNHIIKIILGSTFNASDLVAYTLGILTVLCIDFWV